MRHTRLIHADPPVSRVVEVTSLNAPGKCIDVFDSVDYNVVYSGWEEVLFDDSAWPAPIAVIAVNPFGGPPFTPILNTSWITCLGAELHEFGGGRNWLYRRVFDVPAGEIIGVTLAEEHLFGASLDVITLNGTHIGFPIPPSQIVAGGPNIFAFHFNQPLFLGFTEMCYKFDITYAPKAPPLQLSTPGDATVRLVHHELPA